MAMLGTIWLSPAGSAVGACRGAIHGNWDGWKLCERNGELITPTNDILKPGQILSMPCQYRLTSELRHRVKELEQFAHP